MRYAVDRSALPAAYACHCTDCQTWSGSAFSTQFFVPEADLRVDGVVVEYAFVNPMGRVSTQRFCPTCHTRLYNGNAARPGIVNIRAGTLDDSARIDVPLHIWVRSKQPWVILPVDAEVWEEAAPLASLARLAARTSI
ncbi:GFA family protein [Sphingomonas sp. A2-49]|uniref:GFA family protein n=1 Tax=Sphingomonas sp. A2-49 TaxID=1391375 RepID=UPI0021D3118E|nr:GFA family protein [Sphingomonas sp. A2-49]MCU6452833.1 GFA family protein [Sphingomonas sp. A2-49]